MVKRRTRRQSPDWDELYRTAAAQAGLFTLGQAEACGYSPQNLQKHLASKRIARLRRGIYRLAHFPAGEHEELVAIWLWSDRHGVFSHETSLALHDLGDALPAMLHLTVPEAWRARRLRVPDGVLLHYADLPHQSRTWFDVVPVTTPPQVLAECIDVHVSPELVEQAIRQARQRGLISGTNATDLGRRLRKSLTGPA
ncbi:MAG: type IV toxin-antitoxin system AbiEi family antitoxin domain-containing protein [Planctomycetota bacterium]